MGLIAEDYSNLHSALFTVVDYNGVKMYMPSITTYLRLWAQGGVTGEPWSSSAFLTPMSISS